MSRIIEAAVKLRDGRIVRGGNHRECWQIIVEGNGYTKPRGCIEGFMTDEDKFVGRHTAATLARAAGGTVADPKLGLSSDDLYC